MKILTSCLLFCCFSFAFAQNTPIETEINNQVWHPFVKTYSNMDAVGFMNLHSKDLIRVPIDSKKISNFQEYSLSNQQSNEYNFQRKRKQQIAFSFDERIHSEESAFETGYYKITSTDSTGKESFFYGRFTVVLRRIDRRWKIVVDSDTGKNITEAMFLSGKKLQ